MRFKKIISNIVIVFALLYPCLAPAKYSEDETGRSLTLATEDGLAIRFFEDGKLQVLMDGKVLSPTPLVPLAIRDMTQGFSNFIHGEDLLGGEGSFESSDQFNWSGIRIENTKFPCNTVRSNERAKNGKWSLVTNPRTNSICQSRVIPVKGGKRYRIGGWWLATPYGFPVWRINAPLVETGMYWHMNHQYLPKINGFFIQWLDSSENPLPGYEYPGLAVAMKSIAPQWTLLQTELEAPKDAKGLKVVIQTVTTKEGDRIWLDDIKVIQSPEEPEMAQVEEVRRISEDTVHVRARAGDFLLTSTWRAKYDHIEVEGEVTTKNFSKNRAFDLIFLLPVNDQGGIFFPNLHEERAIEASGIYENSVSALSDNWLPVSLYPYLGIADHDKNLGIALATPPRPQLTRLYYDSNGQFLAGLVHLGISPDAKRLGNRASFSFDIMRFNPDWGLRRLGRKYADIFKKFFTPVFDFWHFNELPEEVHPCYDDSKGRIRNLEEIKSANLEGRLASRYISSSLALQIFRTDNHPDRPAYWEIQDEVNVLDELYWPEESRWPICHDSSQTRHPEAGEIARAVKTSSAIGPNGNPLLFGVSAPKWWSQGWWQARWIPNWDPDLYQGQGRWLFFRFINPLIDTTALEQIHIDFLRWDNFITSATIDHRLEALAVTDSGLSFEPSYYTVGIPTPFSMAELMDFIFGDYLNNPNNEDLPVFYRDRHVGAGANAWAVSSLKFLKLDVYGGEGATEGNPKASNFAMTSSWNPEILDFRRAIAYKKPIRFSNFASQLGPDHAKRFLSLALLYGISSFPNSNVMENWPKESLCRFMYVDNLIDQYARFGWNYIPFAGANDKRIRIERFGDDPDDGIYFITYNSSDKPVRVAITLDLEGLALNSKTGWAMENVTLNPLYFPFNQETIKEFWQKECQAISLANTKRHFPIDSRGLADLGVLPPHETRVWHLKRQQ